MSDNYEEEKRASAAKAVDVREHRTDQIFKDGTPEGEDLRDNIVSYYFLHFSPEDDDPTKVLSLREIARLTIPDDYVRNPKLAGEIISNVVYEVYRQYLIREQEIYDEEVIRNSFLKMNYKRYLVTNSNGNKNKSKESMERSSAPIIKHNINIGARIYPESFKSDFLKIAYENLHPEGVRHAGNVDWEKVLVIINEKYPEYDNIDNTNILRRLRTDFERGIRRNARYTKGLES